MAAALSSDVSSESAELPSDSSPPACTDTSGTDATPPPAIVCMVKVAGDSLNGAIGGYFYGFLAGLVRKRNFRGALETGGSSAKSVAIFSGVYSLAICILKRLRRKDDVVNASLAGCCTGIALSIPGAPQALLANCLSFGAFSYLLDRMSQQQTAMAHSRLRDGSSGDNRGSHRVLPPYTLALPSQFQEGFSAFCKSLKEAKGVMQAS